MTQAQPLIIFVGISENNNNELKTTLKHRKMTMQSRTIILKDEETWFLYDIEPNSDIHLHIESPVNRELNIIYINIPESCTISINRKINAPNHKILALGDSGSAQILENYYSFFEESKSLSEISTDRTNISSIPEFVLGNKSLTRLTFRNEHNLVLSKRLFELRNLDKLSFEYTNKITVIPDEIKKLVNLKHLDLWHSSIQYLSPELFKLPKLNWLNFAFTCYNPSIEFRNELEMWKAKGNHFSADWK